MNIEDEKKINNTEDVDVKAEIYSTPTCMYCNMVKAYLTQHNVKYKDYNVAEDQEKGREMVEMTGQMGVPVIKIGDEIIIGFDQPRIAELLDIK